MSASLLAGRKILITGASSGIGAAAALACSEAGAHVAICARRADRLEAIAARAGALPVSADLTEPAAARAAVEQAAEGLGGLDGLVNNAGLMRPSLVSEGRHGDWRAMFEVNVLGLLSVTHAALPHLETADRADIVNVSSQSGRRVASAASGVYSATKFAVHALSEGLRLELGKKGIRVTIVSPGLVRTELLDEAPPGEGTERLRTMQDQIGLPPDVVAEQIVHAIAQPPEVLLREVVVAPTAQAS